MLYGLFPDADELLTLQPEDLAPVLLRLALPQRQSTGFVPSAVTQPSDIDVHQGKYYPFHKKPLVEQLLNRSWNWLEREGFIEPAAGMNGQHGWRLFTDKGLAVAQGQDMHQLRAISDFPKSLLHPAIRDKCWAAVMRSANAASTGALQDAVRTAFLAVEEAVRAAGKFKPSDYGSELMKKSFDPDNGPLGDRDTSKPRGERAAFQSLFAGATSAYRNPVSHRTPAMDLTEAQDQLLLASHLLRIVDARRPAP